MTQIFTNKRFEKRSARFSAGQVMLITVLVLSGTILAATAVAGLLMLYQIRQSSDIVNSTKAVYAADSGIEWRLYKFFKVDGQKCNPDDSNFLPPALANGATFQVTCDSQVAGGTESVTMKSKGISAKNARAFEVNFTRPLPPPPAPAP